MNRSICLVVAIAPEGRGAVLTLEAGDGFRADYRATALPCACDELLARAVELEPYSNPATNRARIRTLTGDWFEISRNYPRN